MEAFYCKTFLKYIHIYERKPNEVITEQERDHIPQAQIPVSRMSH